jgi:hypothetical protein
MRSNTFLAALLVLGGLAATARAELMFNPLGSAPNIAGFSGTVTGSNFTGGVYTDDTVLDNKASNTFYGCADWQTIQMGHDANNLYVYVHYNNTGSGSTTINPGGSSARNSWMYIASSLLGGPTTLVDGINANVRISGIYYQSSSNYINYSTWNGTAWGTATNLAWGTTANNATELGISGYKIDFEFAIPLSVLGAGGGVAPQFDWVAEAKANVSGGTPATYNYDYYPNSGGFNTYGVPEPGTLALLAAGLVGMCAYAWRKRK